MLKRLIARSGEPFIRQALRQAMRILGDNFVLGRTIEEALSRARAYEARAIASPTTCWASGAKTAADADAISTATWRRSRRSAARRARLGRGSALMARPSVSVKLSAIHPRFEPGKEARLDAGAPAASVELACRRAPAAASASPSTRRSRTAST
jgi:RHH-type proline utilization regulon transcriptional repressor/proline dehydrogenase/delta 1-pyrroline-5-carboxylate dehydrogenase